ncbi:unnamed protein product [Durusdinium trenchii]|uniref:Pentatricopeptide repeat-containing protein, chloroplastic n=1 Tax=Durusdinium trenchii TaxID=1381693 RepID=A0ABP0NQ03_9DINO
MHKLSGLQLQADEFTYRATIQACGSKAWETSLLLLKERTCMSFMPNKFIFSACISCAAKAGQWHIALSLLNDMQQQEVKADNICFNSVLSAFQKKEWLKAIELANSISKQTLRRSAITGCGDWQMALELLAQMDCRAVQKDAFGYSAIIRASVKRSEWLRALHFLTSMEQLAIKDPSSVAFNAALSADFLGDWRKTLDMLLTGRARRTQITEITFSTAIAACENGMQQQLALSLLWDAEDSCKPAAFWAYSVRIACKTLTLLYGAWDEASTLSTVEQFHLPFHRLRTFQKMEQLGDRIGPGEDRARAPVTQSSGQGKPALTKVTAPLSPEFASVLEQLVPKSKARRMCRCETINKCEKEAAAIGVWCSQMLYSAENYMGCAALLSCERRGQEIWLTCPDGYEPDCVTGCVPFEKDCPENDVDLISWVRNHGGFVDERLVIRDGDHGRGLFAKDGENIATTDLLVSLPLELIITDKSSPCAAVRQLRNELQRGKCSFYWPYLKTLHGAHISVPDVWSFEERSLLDGLPTPRGGWQSYSAKYFTDCLDTNADALTLHALMLYHTRAGPFGRLAFRGI